MQQQTDNIHVPVKHSLQKVLEFTILSVHKGLESCIRVLARALLFRNIFQTKL